MSLVLSLPESCAFIEISTCDLNLGPHITSDLKVSTLSSFFGNGFKSQIAGLKGKVLQLGLCDFQPLQKAPTYPAYQRWLFLSAKESHPKKPIGIPRMNLLELPGSAYSIGPIACHLYLLETKTQKIPQFSGPFWRGLLGSLNCVLGGR